MKKRPAFLRTASPHGMAWRTVETQRVRFSGHWTKVKIGRLGLSCGKRRTEEVAKVRLPDAHHVRVHGRVGQRVGLPLGTAEHVVLHRVVHSEEGLQQTFVRRSNDDQRLLLIRAHCGRTPTPLAPQPRERANQQAPTHLEVVGPTLSNRERSVDVVLVLRADETLGHPASDTERRRRHDES
jgi:hypothetical protein